MLLRFTFENAFCFSDEVSLSMVASSDKRHPSHLSHIARPGAPEVLRVAAVYGANGHGKTKMVDALMYVKDVACGTRGDDASVTLKPFKLSERWIERPSRFVVNFRVDQTDYEYGIVVKNGEIEQEWLFENEKRQETILFSRERSKSKKFQDEYDYVFGPKLIKSKSPRKKIDMESYLEFIGGSVPSDKSFLSEATEKHVTRLNACRDWFRFTLQIIKADAKYSNLHHDTEKDKKFLEFLSNSISGLDTGIKNLSIKTTDMNKSLLLAEQLGVDPSTIENLHKMSDNEAAMIGPVDGPSMMLKCKDDKFLLSEFVTTHSVEEGDFEFSLSEESSGTRRLLDLYPMLYRLIELDKVYVVDELDRKLHPLLSYKFVEQFLSGQKGQLIFTTHTTHMLDLDLLRRDEVWIVQKTKTGSSELYSLSDFKIRPDLDIKKGYLMGRFGGIPFVGDAKSLGWH